MAECVNHEDKLDSAQRSIIMPWATHYCLFCMFMLLLWFYYAPLFLLFVNTVFTYDNALLEIITKFNCFLQTAMTIGSSSSTAVPGHPGVLSANPLPSRSQNGTLTAVAHVQTPTPISIPTPVMPLFDAPEQDSSSKGSTNLVKPSSFFGPPPSSSPLIIPPSPSSMPTAPPLQPPGTLERPYGAPLLQPFPPPSPPPSLTPAATPIPNTVSIITRDKVREALLILVQVMIHQLSSCPACRSLFLIRKKNYNS